ncbi:MAG: homoserine kinase [Alicyclobacillus sp.]|nr:homoserine kinase [Alicyclobacillus sp.]
MTRPGRRDENGRRLRLTVDVPATTANLGPGFDCMGMALSWFNTFTVELGHPFRVTVTGESANLLPKGRDNAIVRAIARVFDLAGEPLPRNWRLVAVNRIPVASGLGSSAAAVVGGTLLGCALLQETRPGQGLTDSQVLRLCVDAEGHPDNAVPALLGGGWICLDAHGSVHLTPLQIPSTLVFVVGFPNFPLATEAARRAVPSTVARADAVYNVAQAARLTAALASGDLDLLKVNFGDRLHEPYRQALIPGFDDVRRAAKRAGAKTVTLSGAGPTLLAWCDDEGVAGDVADQMTLAWREHNVQCSARVVRPHVGAARVRREYP